MDLLVCSRAELFLCSSVRCSCVVRTPWQAPTCLQGWIGAEPDVKQERYSTNENAELKRIRHGFEQEKQQTCNILNMISWR